MSVPPHYQCRMCKVQQLQNEMVAHITGWKHCFRYLKHIRAEKMSFKEEEVKQVPETKRSVGAIAAEVEKAEGRGQIKSVHFQVVQDLVLLQVLEVFIQVGLWVVVYYTPPFSEEFSPQGAMMADFPPNIHGPDRRTGGPESMQYLPNNRSMHKGLDGFGMGPRSEDMGRCYPDDLPINGSDGMMRAKGPESSSTLATLLRYLVLPGFMTEQSM